MLLAFLKLGDIGTRSLFLLIVLYSLPVEASGQFGLLMTVLAFWSFFCGFERYIDMQRKMARMADIGPDRIIVENLRFYSFNFLVITPVAIVVLVRWVGLDGLQAALVSLIAIAEHQAGEVYRYALIVPRYRALLWIVLVRGFVLLGFVAVTRLFVKEMFALDEVIVAWTIISVLFLVITAGLFLAQADDLRAGGMSPFWQSMKSHYRASRVHFSIGLLALLSLQADRMIVGSLLSLDQTGIYFRQVFLAMSMYQVATVFSYNRILSSVYRKIQAGQAGGAKGIIRAERRKILPAGLVLAALLLFVGMDADSWGGSLQSVVPALLSGLVFALSLRIAADYNAIVLNAFHSERDIFKSQGVALLVSSLLNVLLTLQYGLYGTVVSVASGALIYLLATSMFARRRFAMQEAVL